MTHVRQRRETHHTGTEHGPTPAQGLDVLLLGTHGQANIGDELLLATFLAQLGPDHHYRVNSYDPATTRGRFGDRYDIEVFDTAGDRLSLLGHLRRCDLVIFAGGSIVKELGTTTGRRRHATLVMLLAVVTAARLVARRPVLMSNIGVGPIGTRLGRVLARLVLRQASLVALRDAASYEQCRRLGCDPARIRLVPDAVWANDGAALGAGSAPPERGGSGMRIGLNLNRDIAVAERWDDFLDELGQALRRLASTRPVEIVGLPMQTGFKADDDLEMLRAFLASLPDIPSSVRAAGDHAEITTRAAGCDVVVAERLHALVIAAIIGRPVVALSYDPKVDQMVAQLDLTTRAVDVNQPFDPASLARMIGEAGDDPCEGARLAAAAAAQRDTLDRYFVDIRRWLARPGAVAGWSDLGR